MPVQSLNTGMIKFKQWLENQMPSPQKGKQRHARIWHSYFLVFERNRK